MHSYQIDVDKRNKPLWVMMFVATVIATMLTGLLNTLHVDPAIKNYMPVPSAFLIFGGLYWIFDTRLWRWSPLKWFFDISEPDLTGVWRGKLKSNTYNKEIDIVLHIRQRWSKISVAINFEKSTSSSYSAAILCHTGAPLLIYNYDNIPYVRESDTMTRHIGTAELRLVDEDTLAGSYFNSGDRKTEGSILVTKK